MSGIILGTLSLVLSALFLVQSPGALVQLATLDFPITAMKHNLFAIAPPVPFSVGATVASLLAWRSSIGKYTLAANLLMLAAVCVLFIQL
jgi:hypothetical protein